MVCRKLGKNDEWHLSVKNSKIIVTDAVELDDLRFNTPQGYFIGINRGEFGGALTFHPSDSENYYYDVGECIPDGMFSIRNNIYLLEGVSHLMIIDG